uniref:Uncharacterized protein n=1 Tax=Cucumis melo TaxID=3656 RepID=A0A9I9ECX7_CUCME
MLHVFENVPVIGSLQFWPRYSIKEATITCISISYQLKSYKDLRRQKTQQLRSENDKEVATFPPPSSFNRKSLTSRVEVDPTHKNQPIKEPLRKK